MNAKSDISRNPAHKTGQFGVILAGEGGGGCTFRQCLGAVLAVSSLLFIALVGCNSGGGMPVRVGEDSSTSSSQDTLVAYFGPCDSANLGSQIWPENSISVYTCMRCGCNSEEQVIDVNNMNAGAQCPQNTQNAFYKWVNGEYQDWECVKPSNNPLYPVPTNPSTTSSESMARETGWVSSSSGRNESLSSEKASSSSVSYLNPNIFYSTMKDGRDGQIYKTVTIGALTWMAQNLNYNVRFESWCYEDDAANCAKYGRLYARDAAMSVCLPGWHLPTKEEWENLFDAVGGQSTAGDALRSLSGWEDGDNGVDTYGFSAVPAGWRYPNSGSYGAGNNAHFWSSTISEDVGGYFLYSVRLLGSSDSVDLNKYGGVNSAFSVRCVKDYAANSENSPFSSSSLSPTTNTSSSSFTQTMSYGILVDARDGQSYKMVKIGEQTWMAENLNYEYPANSYEDRNFCFGNEPANCPKYGRFYKDGVVNRVCPDDWHLPSENEWLDLLMSGVSVKELRSTEGWLNGMNGSNVYGFSALPGGDNVYRGSSGDEAFENEGENACFWSSTLNTGGKTVVCVTRWDTYIFLVADKYHGYIVRCVKD